MQEMMLPPAVTVKPSRLLSDTWKTFRKAPVLLMGLAILGSIAMTIIGYVYWLMLAPELAGPMMKNNFDTAGPGNDATAINSIEPGTFITHLMLFMIMYLVMVQVFSAVLHLACWHVVQGAELNLKAYFSMSLRNLHILVILSILTALCVSLGTILLIVPGLYIGAMLSIVIPAIVIGNSGWQSMKRSAELTKGYRWSILGGFILVMLLAGVINFAVELVGGIAGLSLIAVTLTSAIGLLAGAIFATVVYWRLTEYTG